MQVLTEKFVVCDELHFIHAHDAKFIFKIKYSLLNKWRFLNVPV